jgi:excisionase family DNA binding protein
MTADLDGALRQIIDEAIELALAPILAASQSGVLTRQPASMGAQTDASQWLTVKEATERTARHRDTVTTALRTGDLHGVQRSKHGHWRIHTDCLEAWVEVEPCEHQTEAGKQRAMGPTGQLSAVRYR